MSSLIKSLAFAGLASEANAMLLKKVGCPSGGITLESVDNDFCGALAFAAAATKKVTLAKGTKDHKSFTLKGEDDSEAKEFNCTDVAKCDKKTGKAAEADADSTAANVDTVSTAFTGDAIPSNLVELKSDFCKGGGGGAGTPGKDMCGLLKLATEATAAKPLARDGTDGANVKYDGTSYPCAKVATCDPATGKPADGKPAAEPSTVDAAFDANSAGKFTTTETDLTVVKACTPSAATNTDICGAYKAFVDAAATSLSAVSKSTAASDKFKIKVAGSDKEFECTTKNCDQAAGIEKASGGVSTTAADIDAKAKAKGTTANDIINACAWSAATPDTVSVTTGGDGGEDVTANNLCTLAAAFKKTGNPAQGATYNGADDATLISVELAATTKATYKCTKTKYCDTTTGDIKAGPGSANYKQIDMAEADVLAKAIPKTAPGTAAWTPTIATTCAATDHADHVTAGGV